MNIFKQTRDDILLALTEVLPSAQNTDAITAEPPREQGHGDVATNVAMVVAKSAGKKPRDIAESLKPKLEALDYVEKVEIAGPGFINLTITNNRWRMVLAEVLQNEVGYGNCDIGEGKSINVEYVSANPTGPMHIGHARGAVVGDALARLLQKAGYNVTKEYYINDAGAQIEKLVKSVYHRYCEAAGESVGEISDGLYPGEYLIPVGQKLFSIHGRKFIGLPIEGWLNPIYEHSVEEMMKLIKEDLLALGIKHDEFISERKIAEAGKVEAAISYMKEKGLIYHDILEPPKGKVPEDWEPRKQTLFMSTKFGDDVDRPVIKSDGSWTYFATDMAYHIDKCTRFDKYNHKFDVLINVLGADHGGYVKRIKAVVQAYTGGAVTLEVKLYQLVNFFEDGKPVKMSKRAGTFLTVSDVVEEVGKDVVRFIMLTRKNDMVMDFDFKKVTEQSKDNPVFYVQYAHARSFSAVRHSLEEIPELKGKDFIINDKNLALLNRDEEITLIKTIAQWPRVVEGAAQHFEPHRIVFYLQELAGAFHALWNRGKEDESLRFIIKDDILLTQARLALVKALAITIASGLHVIGVEPVREM